jgi:hypothetical protein
VETPGNQQPLADIGGLYVLNLGPAGARGPFDPAEHFFTGGDPLLVVQSGVPGGPPVSAPSVGNPGSGRRGFKAIVSPSNRQKVATGGTAQFSFRVAGEKGCSDPAWVRFEEYSTLRDPAPVGFLPGTFTHTLPSALIPGQLVDEDVQTTRSVASSIHFITSQLDAGSMSRSLDLVVQVD